MAIPENQHCANCIGTLSFSMGSAARYMQSIPRLYVTVAVMRNKTAHGGFFTQQPSTRTL